MFLFDTSKLHGRIIEKYKTVLAFSQVTSKKKQFVRNVLNGKAQLSHEDMDEWIRLLDIPAEEIDLYFFKPKVLE